MKIIPAKELQHKLSNCEKIQKKGSREKKMFVIPKKPRLFELQSVVHFLIVASSLTYGYGANSTKTFCQNLDGDPVAKILGRGSRRPRQVEKLQNQAGDRNTHSIPKPILVLGEKKAVYLTCQPSSTIH